MLNLALCCKKYYLLMNPILTVMGLDNKKKDNNQKSKPETKKNKNKKKDQ